MLLNVATIASAVGLKGEVNLFLHTDIPLVRLKVGNALLGENGEEFRVKTFRVQSSKGKDRFIVSFEGYDDRNSAEKLRGTLLQIETNDGDEKRESGEFYIAELVGLKVFEKKSDNEKSEIGKVSAVIPSAQDLLEVKLKSGEAILIPFVDKIVEVVDLQGGFIEVDMPTGLIEAQRG